MRRKSIAESTGVDTNRLGSPLRGDGALRSIAALEIPPGNLEKILRAAGSVQYAARFSPDGKWIADGAIVPSGGAGWTSTATAAMSAKNAVGIGHGRR